MTESVPAGPDLLALDQMVAKWGEGKGLPASRRLDGRVKEFDTEFFTWRFGDGTESLTLRVSRRILENIGPRGLIGFLSRERVADQLQSRGCLYVLANATGGPQLSTC